MQKVIYLFFLLCPFMGYGQQDLTFSLYTFNSAILNPAHAGTFDQVEIHGLGRLQWMGVEGAPKSFVLSANVPVSDKAGFSAGILYDELGPTQRRTAYGDIGSSINITDKLHISFGLRGKMTNYSVGLTRLETVVDGDGSYNQDINETTNLNVGAGVVLYSDRFYAGVSMPSILENSFSVNTTLDLVLEQRHLYSYVGYKFPINSRVELNPSVLIKSTQDAPLDIDFNAMVVFDKRISLSLIYSHLDGVGASVFYDISNKVRLGFAYEYPTTEINIAGPSTVEFGARYLLGEKRNRVISPVYFNY